MHNGHPTKAATPDTLRQALIVAAYLIKTYPQHANRLGWTITAIRARLANDPVSEATAILEAYTRDGGLNAIRDKSLDLNFNST